MPEEEEEQQRSGTGGRREEPMAPTGATEQDEAEAARMANRFDIRRLIGAVFVLYGLILLALGIFGSHAVKTKAAGININLWAGLGMLVFGCLMIFWALARPVEPEPEETRGQGSGRIRRAPAT
jgi:NADH:ubiquinone oxidoreductase subunit 6 (subunit J)